MSSQEDLDLQVVKEADQVTRRPMRISASVILVISTLPLYMPVHGFQAFSHVQSISTLFCFALSCKPPFQTGALGPTCPYCTPRCQGGQVQGQGVVGVPRSSDPKSRAHTAARDWPGRHQLLSVWSTPSAMTRHVTTESLKQQETILGGCVRISAAGLLPADKSYSL